MLPARLRSLFSPRSGGEAVCVLTYHSIGESDTPLTVTAQMFERQMRWLKENTTPISAEDLRGFLAGGELPPTPVLVTFDDGYRDNFTAAWPVLRSYGIPALIFVCTGFVDARFPLYAEMLPALSWSQIRELHSSGQVEFGAHTTTHVRLPEVSLEVARKTILDSKDDLEQALGVAVLSFCYPQGRFNRAVIEAVRHAGFVMAFGGSGLISRDASSLCLPRLQIERTTSLEDLAAGIAPISSSSLERSNGA